MNEKTRILIEEMKKQTIGVEVEMYNITRKKAARTIAEYFHTEGVIRQIKRCRFHQIKTGLSEHLTMG